jgi:hypothetical protein
MSQSRTIKNNFHIFYRQFKQQQQQQQLVPAYLHFCRSDGNGKKAGGQLLDEKQQFEFLLLPTCSRLNGNRCQHVAFFY